MLNNQTRIAWNLELSTFLLVELNFKMGNVSFEQRIKMIKMSHRISQWEFTRKLENDPPGILILEALWEWESLLDYRKQKKEMKECLGDYQLSKPKLTVHKMMDESRIITKISIQMVVVGRCSHWSTGIVMLTTLIHFSRLVALTKTAVNQKGFDETVREFDFRGQL